MEYGLKYTRKTKRYWVFERQDDNTINTVYVRQMPGKNPEQIGVTVNIDV